LKRILNACSDAHAARALIALRRRRRGPLAFLGMSPPGALQRGRLFFAWADASPGSACLRNVGTRRIISSQKIILGERRHERIFTP
jgi:hypothetical protein